MLLLLCVMLCLASCLGGYVPTHLAQCTHNDHCGPSSCCKLGYYRYSSLDCLPLGDVNSPCHVKDQKLKDMTLYYPNGMMVELESAYRGMCPCKAGLFCSSNSTCQPKT